MKTVKFETVKQNAKSEFYHLINSGSRDIVKRLSLVIVDEIRQGGYKRRHDLQKRIIEAGTQIIERWDIRMAKQLLELFPNAAKSFTGKTFAIDQDENNNWILILS